MIMNGVRRLLGNGAEMVPLRSTTMYAPVELPEELLDELAFGALPARYVDKIFNEVGYPFDLRLCVKGLNRSHLLGEPQVFEDLDFSADVDPEVRHSARHAITRGGRMDGFLVWLTLDTGAGEKIDILEHEHCWLPVFFPLFERGVEVAAGDRIDAISGAVLSEDRVHPDYFVEGTLLRPNSEPLPFRHYAAHHARVFRGSPFYEKFFRASVVPRLAEESRPAKAASIDVAALKNRLRERLPEHMVPEAFVQLDRLPLMPSGKLDRRALPASAAQPAAGGNGHAPPRSEAEKIVARIWQELLNLSDAGLETNFFDHGGHSLLLLRVQDRIKDEMGMEISVTDLFKYPTVETLARRLSPQSDAPQRGDDQSRGHKRAAARQQALGRIADRRGRPLASGVVKDDAQ